MYYNEVHREVIRVNPAIDGVVLAGGRSSRMSKDKGQLQLPDGMDLLQRATGLLNTVVTGRVWISRPWGYPSSNRCDLVDTTPYAGPLSGIERALECSQANYLAVLAIDLPGLPIHFYQQLKPHLSPQYQAVLPKSTRHSQPLAGFWSADLMSDLHVYRQRGGHKVDEFLASHAVCWVLVPDSWLANINTPKDWQSWLASSFGKGM